MEQSYKTSIAESCKTLKLSGIKSCLDTVMSDAYSEKWTYERLLSELLKRETE